MLQLKRNDLLIGFTISVLLSIFVNFALLMRKYEFETGNPSMGIQPPDRTMYYLLIWFFVFSFILFIVNSLMYKLGDKLFRRKEYKRVLLVCVTCISIAYGMFHLSPVLYTAIFVEWLGGRWAPASYPGYHDPHRPGQDGYANHQVCRAPGHTGTSQAFHGP